MNGPAVVVRKRKIVHLTLSPEAIAALVEIAANRGASKSAIVEALIRAQGGASKSSTVEALIRARLRETLLREEVGK